MSVTADSAPRRATTGATPAPWMQVDVLVVGSGAAGISAALAAQRDGASVLLIEKTDRIGGSTAVSGGAVWAPLNAQSAAVGHPDTAGAVHEYLRHTVGDAGDPAMLDAFVDNAHRVLDVLGRDTSVQLTARTYSPDYHPDRPGAALGGRSLDPDAFDGRLLGRHFRELRDPLPEFTVLGGMMVTMTGVRHLLGATRSFASWRAAMKLVLRHAADRARGMHRGSRLVLGNALAARLFHSMLQRSIAYWLDSPLLSLLTDDGGRVTGALVRHDGVDIQVRTRGGVVVATGGFPWNAALREALYPGRTGPWSMAPAGNTGDGIVAARRAGAVLGTGHHEPAFWAPVSILRRDDGSELRYPHLVWDRARPGLMSVGPDGRRFVDEATSYHEFVRAMYRRGCMPAWLVADHDFVERWGLGLALPGGRAREHLVRAGYLLRAGSLQQLAAQMGVDATALQASADAMNEAARTGHDEAFGKGGTAYDRYLGDPSHRPNPCLGPVRRPPFHAVRVYAGDIGTAVGIRCTPHTEALRADGTVVPGLYVAGNDMHSVMGGEYPAPGITLGPALTFGWIAGEQAAARAVRVAASATPAPARTPSAGGAAASSDAASPRSAPPSSPLSATHSAHPSPGAPPP